ncbi:FAD-dependent oxidoreductase [Amycolatopsis acidicola]|uniref:FAD-dependent oxidoreductase n=1 Tax=Amycolatopsis acidicola TaxID=2596893 RepID=A0A5N0VI91_9PSEU|nr:FAD-dependent oxidoreductase [Amycolatopsis acidicola]KAA9166097.1 FAD-dependent oxidoreductase [Amycolatopsis acidicola]
MDVIIAGAGPVGLLLAAELALHDVDVVVLEKLPRPTGFSKAAGLHARSTESMELRGLVDLLTERGRQWFEDGFADRPELLAKLRESGNLPVPGHFAGIQKLRHDLLDTNHPGLLGIPQSALEDALAGHAAHLGAKIQRGKEVLGVEQDDDGVTVHTGDSSLRAEYLVGCDGGRSVVRKLAGFSFPGHEPTTTSWLADIAVPELLGQPAKGHRRTPGGTMLVTPFRILVTEKGVAPHQDPVTVAEVEAAVSRVAGQEIRFRAEPKWISRFTDVTRLAEPYRLGRVLLAGDAAHVHAPSGGQGLNLGLQDAMNLGWKLAAAVAGWAPPGLLDTYGTERRPVAARVLHNTRAQTALAFGADALHDVFAELMDLEQVNRHLGEMITGVNLRYDFGPDNPRVGAFVPAPLRSLLRNGRPVLTGANAEGWQDRVDTAPGDEPMLVRPDGYVVWAGEGPVTDVLTRWFGPPSAS